MAQQTIGIGSAANDGTGDALRTAFDKANTNFNELYGGAHIHAATGKSTPADADELALIDSAALYVLKKLTWANLKATLKTYFDALYDWATVAHGATGKATPVDADELSIVDSAASNVIKKLTWANLKATLKTYFDALYDWATVAHAATGKTTPADADEFSIVDSAASNVIKKLTWANLKAAIWAVARTKVITLTRVGTAANGSVSYTGVGFTPSALIAFGAVASGSPQISGGVCGAGFGQGGVSFYDTGKAFPSTSLIILWDNVSTGGGTSQSFTVTSFDSDGFTGTWTKSGSPAGWTGSVSVLCLR